MCAKVRHFRIVENEVCIQISLSQPFKRNSGPDDTVRCPRGDLLDLLPLESLHLGREGDGASAVTLATLTHAVGAPGIHLSPYRQQKHQQALKVYVTLHYVS